MALLVVCAACGSQPGVAPLATTADASRTAVPSSTAAATPTATPVPTASPKPLPAMSAFQRGMTFADWRTFTSPRSGLYDPATSATSLQNLAATGATWIALVVACGQELVSSTTVSCAPPRSATDAELRRVVDMAHDLGLRVLLKPQLDPSKEADPARWRGEFGSAFTTETQWKAWFASYREMMLRFAALSEAGKVDLLAIGTELGSTTHRVDDWRSLIRDIRQAYHGSLTYASLSSTGARPPHGEEQRITWWDAVDYIGIDAYYPLTTTNATSAVEVKNAWTTRGYIAMLEALSKKFNKPVIFTEVGFRSVDGAGRSPGSFRNEAPLDMQEQADLYQGTLEALWGKPWLGGMFWWQWFVDPKQGGPQNDDFTPFGKPAENVLRSFYLEKQ